MRQVVVGIVAVHSVVLGFCMCAAPRWTLGMVGWGIAADAPRFFLSQSGIFLIILGTAYAYGVVSRPFSWLLAGSKGAAILFLMTAYFTGIAPGIILLTGMIDGAMGAVVAILLLHEQRQAEAS